MADQKKVKKLNDEIEGLNDEIEQLKDICRELKGNDNEMCTPQLRKKAASGQHGRKDNVTRGQAREGLEERIDQLKRDRDKLRKQLDELLDAD